MAFNPYLNNPYMPAYQYQGVMPQSMAQPQMTQPIQQVPVASPAAPPPIQPSQNNIIWVSGEADARSFPVIAGNSVMLMDSEQPVAYKKTTDMSGKPLPLEIYDIVKREPDDTTQTEEKVSADEFLTKKEFLEFKERIETKIGSIGKDVADSSEQTEKRRVRRHESF